MLEFYSFYRKITFTNTQTNTRQGEERDQVDPLAHALNTILAITFDLSGESSIFRPCPSFATQCYIFVH